MSNKREYKKRARGSTLRRLVWANVIAALALLTLAAAMLQALGLLESILLFFF